MSTTGAHKVSLVRAAALRPDGFVALDLVVDGVPVTGIVHRSRAAGAPEAPSHDLEAAAMHFTAMYVENHPLLFHRLFTSDAVRRGEVISMRLHRQDVEVWLTFSLIADGVPCDMSVSAKLQARAFRPPTQIPVTDEDFLLMLWASALDVCLSHMISKREMIHALGFDTSEMVRQLAELPAGVRA